MSYGRRLVPILILQNGVIVKRLSRIDALRMARLKNPKMYESNFVNTKIQMTAREKQEKDIRRIKILEKQGYEITIIWESELNEYIETLK